MKYLTAISKETGLELASSRRNKWNFEKNQNDVTVLSEVEFKDYMRNNFVDECDFIECEAKLR
jgi:hypothetical protein